ncbi:MAG: ATP-binding protein [Nitrososphaerales archaeon]
MSDPSLQPQILNLGTAISKGEIDSSFFMEENEESTEPFQVDANLISTGRTCVIGSSGSGKSYTVGVICEELCKAKVPFAIIDLEGEYSGLKEKYEVIWVGDDEGCDLMWSKKVDLKQLARYAPDCPPIILDVSEVHRPREKVNEFLIALYSEISKRRTPYLVILEEADRFSPQSGGERLPIIDEIARRGRKRGLGLMICTQRPSLVDKNILSQCSNQLIGKLVIKNDLNSVAQFFSGRDAPNVLTSLKPGEFFALGGLSPEPAKVKMRVRETRHGGMTPKLNPAAVRPSVERLLESIQTAMPLAVADTQEDVIAIPKPEIVRELPPAPKVIPLNYKIDRSVDDEIAIPEETGETVAALPMDDFLDWDTRKTTGLMGFTPLIERETVPGLLKLEKSYKLFGQKENVTRVGIAYRPLIEIGIRIRSGVLKKKFETKYFFMDGVNGKLVEITDRLGFQSGIEKLLGLDEGQVIILKTLHPDKDLSLIEIASASKRMEDDTRTLLKGLETRRLVRSTKLGKAKMYRRLADVPKVDLLSKPLLKLNELDPSEGFKLAKIKIKEDQVREVVKGMWKGADVESFKQIYYPVYLAELILNRKKRYVWIDGRTGKEIEF